MQEETLRNKTIKGVGWSAADAFLGQGVTFVVGLVLARLLSPDEYGLIGICLIFNTVLNGIVDSGLSNALIRKKNVTDEDYNTMFITNMVISILLYMLLYFSSSYISHFFQRNELSSLIKATGLLLFLNALSLTHVTILTKRIDFKTKTRASILSAIMSGVIGISMAYMGLGVWALVGQMLSKQLVYTLTIWMLIKWVPSLKFSLDAFHYMWGFGWKLLVSGLLNSIWNQLYQVVVGKFYSPATLGQYTRARQFSSIFSDNLTSIVQRVSYPVLSNIQDEKERMIEAYRKVIKMTMFVTVLVLFSLGAVSEPLIHCLIGEKWHQAALFLPLICISMSLYPLHAINLNMLQVQGRSDIFLYLEIIKKFISIGPICIGIFVGIYWMLLASILTGVLSFFLNSYYTGKNLGYSSWAQLCDVAPTYGIAIIIVLSVYFIKFLPLNGLVVLLLQIFVGLIVFFLSCHFLKNEEFKDIRNIISNLIKSKK